MWVCSLLSNQQHMVHQWMYSETTRGSEGKKTVRLERLTNVEDRSKHERIPHFNLRNALNDARPVNIAKNTEKCCLLNSNSHSNFVKGSAPLCVGARSVLETALGKSRKSTWFAHFAFHWRFTLRIMDYLSKHSVYSMNYLF